MDIIRQARLRILDLTILFVLVAAAGFLTFYQLGNMSLHPWDEAWYATISRNLVQSHNLLELRYNQAPFWDHPPLGFYLTAISYQLFGVNEFAARAPQAALAVMTIVVAYLAGTKLRNRWVGVIAALIILSSRWFIFRARSGNLDILLLSTQLTFFWLAFTTRFHRRLWLPAIAFGLAMLSKTTISITLAPMLLLAWYERLRLKPLRRQEVIVTAGALITLLVPWYGYNAIVYGPKFLIRTIFEIGLRKGSASGVSALTLTQTLLYMHSAVHRWYSLFLLSLGAGAGLWLTAVVRKKWTKTRTLTWVLLYLFLVGFPYLLSAQTEIWHLIPLIAPMALLIALVGSMVIEIIASWLKQWLTKKTAAVVGHLLFLSMVLVITLTSLRAYWKEFINLPPAISEPAQLSQEISNKNLPLFLTNDAFAPTVVFYADLRKKVKVVREDEFEEVCRAGVGPFLFIGTQSLLDQTTGWTKLNQRGDLILLEYDRQRCIVQ
jgi:4-amino-4-deoxy-L-arabinose transferase-like glycosyltransferase